MSIIRLLKGKKDRQVKTGIITEQKGSGYYNVQIGAKTIRIKSAVASSLPVGSQVVIAETDGGSYIVGEEKIKIRRQEEVVVDG